jgi:phage regulator Rha-like protein
MSKSVTCSDCHNNEGPGKKTETEMKKRCQECHNSNYIKWFEEWEGILTEKEQEIEKVLNANGSSKNNLDMNTKKMTEMYETIKREKYHNLLYASDLLDYYLRQLRSP